MDRVPGCKNKTKQGSGWDGLFKTFKQIYNHVTMVCVANDSRLSVPNWKMSKSLRFKAPRPSLLHWLGTETHQEFVDVLHPDSSSSVIVCCDEFKSPVRIKATGFDTSFVISSSAVESTIYHFNKYSGKLRLQTISVSGGHQLWSRKYELLEQFAAFRKRTQGPGPDTATKILTTPRGTLIDRFRVDFASVLKRSQVQPFIWILVLFTCK